MQSSEYTDAAVAEGKQVVVVGSGKSAIDIALHASDRYCPACNAIDIAIDIDRHQCRGMQCL